MHKTTLLVAGTAIAVGSLMADPQTRSDIEGLTVPSGWDASNRTVYQVDVSETACEWLDSRPNSVAEIPFDLDSRPFGFLLLLK